MTAPEGGAISPPLPAPSSPTGPGAAPAGVPTPDPPGGFLGASPGQGPRLTGDVRLLGVTAAVAQLPAGDGLPRYYAREVATTAVNMAEHLPALVAERGAERTVRYLADAPERGHGTRPSAAANGTAAHLAFEQYAVTGRRPEGISRHVAMLMDGFERWADRWQPSFILLEATVYNLTEGYGGTLDALVEVGGLRLTCDYKTTENDRTRRGDLKRPWPKVGAQIAPYRFAEWLDPTRQARREYVDGRGGEVRAYVLGPENAGGLVPMPRTDGGLVLFVTPERVDPWLVRCDEVVFRELFLPALALARGPSLETLLGPRLSGPADLFSAERAEWLQ